jgi:hypothetical protein
MNVEAYLKQNGFKFAKNGDVHSVSKLQGFYDYHKRIEYKKKNIESYPQFFELLVKEIMISEFGFNAESGIKIIDEGSGGDFDVLAINNANELVYLECKTGQNIKEKDMKEFYSRHLFLKPDISIVVFDQPKKNVYKYLALMRTVLTKYAKSIDRTIAKQDDYQYPEHKIIPEEEKEFAYHMNRNLFFCSGENIVRGITHCLRHYNGVVKQTSYWG